MNTNIESKLTTIFASDADNQARLALANQLNGLLANRKSAAFRVDAAERRTAEIERQIAELRPAYSQLRLSVEAASNPSPADTGIDMAESVEKLNDLLKRLNALGKELHRAKSEVGTAISALRDIDLSVGNAQRGLLKLLPEIEE